MRYYELLEDAVDLHMHPGPTKIPTRIDFFEAAADAEAAHMKAIVFKPLYFTTMDRAFAAERSVTKLRVFGGIVLDHGMGGLNPTVVKNAIEMGAKFVWMPLFDSKQTLQQLADNPAYGSMVAGQRAIEILSPEGELLPAVKEILDIVSTAKDVILETSHLSPTESIALIDEAKKRNIQNILVTHPLFPIIGASQDEIRLMVEKGAVINHCVAACYPNPIREALNPQIITDSIKDVGAENCVLSTDLGMQLFPSPLEGLRGFCQMMLAAGISQEEITLMIKDNPTRILGLA